MESSSVLAHISCVSLVISYQWGAHFNILTLSAVCCRPADTHKTILLKSSLTLAAQIHECCTETREKLIGLQAFFLTNISHIIYRLNTSLTPLIAWLIPFSFCILRIYITFILNLEKGEIISVPETCFFCLFIFYTMKKTQNPTKYFCLVYIVQISLCTWNKIKLSYK